MKNCQKAKIIKIEQRFDGYRIFYQVPEQIVRSYTIHYGLLNFTGKELANANKRGAYTAIYVEDSIINAKDLSLSEKLTYIFIKSFCNTKNEAYPSIGLLADVSGHSHTTIIEAIDGLTKKEVITAVRGRRREGDDQRYLNNIYKFRGRESKYETYVPFNIVFSKGLSINAKMLYIFLLAKVKNGYMVTITKKELHEYLGLRSWDTIRGHIDTLHKLGFIFTYCSATKGPEKEKSICFLLRRICPKELMITDEDIENIIGLEAMI